MKRMKCKGAAALLFVVLTAALCACGGKETAGDSKAQTGASQAPQGGTTTFELDRVGTFDDVYAALLDYALTTEDEVLVEKDEALEKLYGIYPPGSQGVMIYDPYIKMTVHLNEDNSLAYWGIGLPFNKDWVADGTLTAAEALNFGRRMLHSTLPGLSDVQFEEMLTALQWPSEEEFTQAVTTGDDPGTAGGAVFVVGGGEGFCSLTLAFNTQHSQFTLAFSKDL